MRRYRRHPTHHQWMAGADGLWWIRRWLCRFIWRALRGWRVNWRVMISGRLFVCLAGKSRLKRQWFSSPSCRLIRLRWPFSGLICWGLTARALGFSCRFLGQSIFRSVGARVAVLRGWGWRGWRRPRKMGVQVCGKYRRVCWWTPSWWFRWGVDYDTPSSTSSTSTPPSSH